MRTTVVRLCISASLVPAACVTKKDYEALQRELDSTRERLTNAHTDIDNRNKSVLGLEAALAAEVEKRDAAEAEASRLQDALAEREARLESLQREKDDAIADLADALASRKALRASVEDMKQALKEAAERRTTAEKRISEFKRMLQRFRPLMDAGKLDIRITDGRMVLVLPMDILFESGKATLSDDGTTAVTEVGGVLATLKDRAFQVEGHTDNVPIRTKKYPSNWELASARALVVLRTIIAAGVKPRNISAASFGEFKPAVANDSAENRSKNRRIEIVIVPDLSGLPGFDELNELAKPATIERKI